MIEGALILLAGIVVGRFMPGRRRKRQAFAQAAPICGCDHHRSFHKGGGACSGKVRTGNWFDGVHFVECTCRGYVGPEPLPEFFAQEIGS